MRHLLCFLFCTLLAGCGTQRKLPVVERVMRDTVQVTNVKQDSVFIYRDRTVCDTLENSQTCLKTGRSYPLCLVKCHQFGRKMICVGKKQACEACVKQQEVSYNTRLPKRCTLLKPGNGIHGHREGHILVGTRAGHGLLVHPKSAFDSLYGRIRKSLERGHSVSLKIKEDRL